MTIRIEQEFEINEIAYMISNEICDDEIEQFLRSIYGYSNARRRKILASCCNKLSNEWIPKPKVTRWEDLPISGAMFVLTGDFDLGKKYWQNYILKRGGIVKSSVNHNVKYLVKENGKLDGTRSVKEVEARNLNIPIIDIDTLRKMR